MVGSLIPRVKAVPNVGCYSNVICSLGKETVFYFYPLESTFVTFESKNKQNIKSNHHPPE